MRQARMGYPNGGGANGLIWLDLAIIQRALIGCLLAGVINGLVGVFVVKMKLTSIGYCMSHAAFAGAALGIILSADPLITALLFSAMVASIIGPVSDKAKLHADAIISIAFLLNMALAFIFLNLIPGIRLSSEVTSILWGSVISVSYNNIVYLSSLCFMTAAVIYLLWKEFLAIMFNRKLAEADGINTRPFVYFIILLAGIVVTLSLKLVGGLLVFALLFNPAATSLQFLYDMKKIIVFSPILGAITCVSGLLLSLILDWPVGSCIVIVSTLMFALAVLFSPKRRRGGEEK